MAHGFLTPTPVSGDNFWKNLKTVSKGLKDLFDLYRNGNKILKAYVREVDPKQLTAGQTKALPPASQKAIAGSPAMKMLKGNSGAITKTSGGLVEKNPTNIDVKNGKRLPPGGPRLPGSSGGEKGGTFTNIGGSGGLNASNFFTRAQSGVGSGGEYLTKAQRIADFRKSQEMRSAAAGSPPISPDSGADIVAAVNKNTQMIISLVDATKKQTSTEVQLTEKQIQAQETLMSRAAARAEERNLEEGSDLSGFMTPENFAKKKQQEAKKETGSKLKEIIRGPNPFKQDCCCGGGGGIGDIIGGAPGGGRPRGGGGRRGGLPIPDFVRQKGMMPGGVFRRGGQRALTRGAAMIGGKAAAKGVAKGLGKMGLKKIPGVGAVAGAAFAAERAMKGDWLGAGGELLSGLAGTIPGIGTGVSAAIDAGLMARDAGLTPFARGGIVTQPTTGLVGEAGQEGVFPLEGSRGKKTFLMFGEGLLNAQLDNDKDYAKLQSMGLKQYYENEGGFEKMGNIFGDLFKGLGGILGSVGNSLLGGAANAAGMFGGGFASADEQQLTEALIAGEEGMRTKAYKDSEGIWTIGYGQTTLNGRAVKEGDEITKEQALSGFRSNVQSHRQRAINQVGEDRWSKLDPKARAVLTSLAYNYGSIPDAVLPAAKTGSTEDIAKSMDQLYGHNKGVLKGRRQREQSILRGGTSERLDKDFLAGGALAAETSGPMIIGGATSGSSAALADTATRLKGLSTKVKETDYGENGCVYAVNKVFQAAGMTPPWGSALYVPTAEEKMIQAGWQAVPYNQAAPGDVFVMKDRKSPPQAHIGIMQTNGKIISNSSSKAAMTWEDTIAGYNSRYGGQGTLYRMPSTVAAATASNPPPSNTPPVVASTKHLGKGARKGAATNSGAVAATPPSSPGPVPASPAAANTGTPIMATSAQVAMASAAPSGAAPTIINNYYGGGGQQGGVVPNGVSAGIGMGDTGTAAFAELRLRTLA